MKTGGIILGHGSRKAAANQVVLAVAEMLRPQVQLDLLQVAFLSFASPTLPEAVDSLVYQGAEKIIVAPLFLVGGRHMREHIPAMIAAQQQRVQGQAAILFAGEIGPDPRLAAILADRIRGADGGNVD